MTTTKPSNAFSIKRDFPFLFAMIPDWTTILIYSGALANIALWVRSGEMINGDFWVSVSSWGLGFLMSFGPVQIIKQWAKLSPTIERTKKGNTIQYPNFRWWLAISAFCVILASEAVLLGPVIVAMLSEKTLLEILGTWITWWSVGRVLVSAIALGGLSAVLPQKSDAVRAKTQSETPETNGETKKKPGKKPATVSRKPITNDQLIAELKRNPGVSDEQLAQLFNVSRQAINKRRRKLTPAQLGF